MLAALVALASVATPAGSTAAEFHGLTFEPPRSVPDVEFIDQRRQPVRFADYRGSLVLPYFGFLSAPLDDTEDFARELNAYFAKEDVGSAAGYLVNHTTTTFVIDRRSRLVLAFPLKTRASEITDDLQLLLEREVSASPR